MGQKLETERFKKYVNLTGNIILSLDRKGRIFFLNKEGHKILGYKNGELTGKDWFEKCIPEEERSAVRKVFEKCVNGKVGLVRKHTNSVVTKKGNKRIIEWNNDVLKNEKGNVVEIISSGKDITEEYRAMKTVQENEKKFRLIVENLPFIAFVLDRNGRLVYANREAEKTAGLNSKLFFGKKFSEFGLLGKKDLMRAFLEFRKNLKGNVTEKSAYKIKTNKGERIVELIGIPLFENGKVVGVLDVGTDVTENKSVSEMIEKHRKQMLSIFDSIEENIYVSDPKTYEVLYINPTLKRALKRDAVGEICYKAFQNRNSPCDFCTNKIILKNKGKPYKWQYHNPVINRDYLITDKIIKWPDGRDVRFEFAVDITEQKLMGEALKESEEKFRAIAEAAQDAIIMINDRGEACYWNRAAEKVFGYSEKEVLGRNLHSIIAPKKYEKDYKKGLEEFRKTGKGNVVGKTVVLSGLRKGGEEFPIELSLSSIKLRGRWYAVAIIRDISERKNMEDELRKSKKELEKKVSELERFSRLSVGRELRMIELKRKIRELERKLENRRFRGDMK